MRTLCALRAIGYADPRDLPLPANWSLPLAKPTLWSQMHVFFWRRSVTVVFPLHALGQKSRHERKLFNLRDAPSTGSRSGPSFMPWRSSIQRDENGAILYYTMHYTLYTIYYILYTIYYILYTIYYILYTLYYILYTILYYTILYYTIL